MDIARIRQKYPDAQMFTFGDSKSLCDELLALVRAGKKTATCGALTEFEDDPTAMPKVGRTDIAQTWEGEDDDLEGWRRGHRSYFERNGGFDPRMKLVCERFEVVEIF